MTVSIGTAEILERAEHRILYTAKWQGEETVWLPMKMQGPTGTGFTVERMRRASLPEIGEAVFRYYYGEIDGQSYSVDEDGVATLPNFVDMEIRIQQATVYDEDGNVSEWATVWWGQVVAQQDHPATGAPIGRAMGHIDFHCRDALHRCSRWLLDKHQTYTGGVGRFDQARGGCYGHPGYNREAEGLRVLGNRAGTQDPGGLGYYAHTWGAAADTWSDLQALEHAIASATPFTAAGGDVTYQAPLFEIIGSTDALDTVQVWKIDPGTTLLEFLTRVLDRRRGRGVAALDWVDNANGSLTPYLYIKPQFGADIEATLPSGATFTVEGAVEAGTSVAVDLMGDHRIAEQGATLEITEHRAYGRLESLAETLRVLVTVGWGDSSWSFRWTDDETDDYDDATPAQRKANSAKFGHVYRATGFPFDWGFLCGDTDEGNLGRCDYRVSDVGTIVEGAGQVDTSPLLVEVANELCVFSGFNYAVSPPARYQTPAAGQENDPEAMPIRIWYRVKDSPQRFVDLEAQQSLGVRRGGTSGQDLIITGNEDSGVRFLERYAEEEERNRLALTLTLELPHRLRMATGEASARANVKTIYHRGLRLDLAHPEAIWTLDETVSSDGGYAAKRQAGGGARSASVVAVDQNAGTFTLSGDVSGSYSAGGQLVINSGPNAGTYTVADVDVDGGNTVIEVDEEIRSDQSGGSAARVGVLRDDRDRLAKMHALAAAWYLQTRYAATWSLAADGMAGTWTDASGTAHEWPALGDFVTTMAAAGRSIPINAAITAISWERQSGRTTWETSWADLDFSA